MSKFFKTFVATIIWTLLSFNVGPHSTEQASDREIKILAFGDSLTACYRLAKDKAYPAQLEQLLNKDGLKARVVNAGVSGDTSAQALRRVQWSQKAGPFDAVLIAIGANDGLRLMPTSGLEKNLNQMIGDFLKVSKTVCLLGIRLPLNLPADYRAQFESIYPRLAKTHKLCYLPFILEGVATVEEYNLEDQIHPNERGQVIVAANVYKVLKPHISSSKP
jgi:acyl-CoA thioesterase-1